MNADDLLPPGVEIDLDNCAREPIHIPGSIQPRGVLLVVEEPVLLVRQVSANVHDVLGVPIEDVLEHHLADALGRPAVAQIERAVVSFSDLRERNPIEVVVDVRGEPVNFDVIVHREPDNLLLVEVETAEGPRPFSFPNTYLAVRGAVSELNRAATLQELYEITARSVRELTGFDRVMVYRYDADYNGEVVAEHKRADLNSFVGQHYPASDIPAQARALYEKNWIRLISDIHYRPSPVVPVDNPATGAPLDLTYATLRSVSPIHVEYLHNMGVDASMSISLLREGRLWGLIACHHYSGPHTPPYGTRAAAEFLGSALSLRLVARYEEDELREQVQAQAVLGKLGATMLDNRHSVVDALLGSNGLLELVEADGVAVHIDGQRHTAGPVPQPALVDAIVARTVAGEQDVAVTTSLPADHPDLAVPVELASGALVVRLPEDQFVAWFRAEEPHTVDWGGDPHNKAIAEREGDHVRLSPRKSFERWREVVRGRSRAWSATDLASARQLRGRVVDALYGRARDELRLAERLQRSLLPKLPDLPGWVLTAHYEPAAGGQIGGDWYDAFEVPGQAFAAVLGDVAGHGIDAAGTMAQLRNVLRAHLFEGLGPAAALARVNAFAVAQVERPFATVAVVRVDLRTGDVVLARAGHPAPFLCGEGDARQAGAPRPSPPLGVRGARFTEEELAVAPGESLVFFSDGLVERRGHSLDEGLDRLAAALRGGVRTADDVWQAVQDDEAADDATVLTVRRG